MKRRSKTNRLKAALRRKNIKRFGKKIQRGKKVSHLNKRRKALRA